MRAFTFPYCILFAVFGFCLLEACCFLKGDREGLDLGEIRGGGNLEGVEGGELWLGVLYDRGIYFQIKKSVSTFL